jgi:hypothetical protein
MAFIRIECSRVHAFSASWRQCSDASCGNADRSRDTSGFEFSYFQFSFASFNSFSGGRQMARGKKNSKRKFTGVRVHRAKAIQMLNDPLFLYKAGQRVAKLGVIGERRNILILVLAGIARTLPKPPHVLIQGPTSSGKTTLIKTTLHLFPPSCVEERAGLSAKALAHGKGSLANKILFIQEYRCGKDAQQLLRLLQSEGRVTHEYTA